MTLTRPHGWMFDQELAALCELAAGQRVLEIGCWCGRSTQAMAQVAAHVVSVDHFDGDPDTHAVLGHEHPTQNWVRNQWHDAVRGLPATLIEGDFREVSQWLTALPFGFVFYDAVHDAASTRAALDWAWAGVAKRDEAGHDWRIAVHDYKPRELPATCAAIDDWAQSIGLRRSPLIGSLAIFRKY